jgi:1,4-dihydroxy-6-naphthoate synthase
VIPAVREGRADLGLVIHEGQVTFQDHGLTKILDLGQSWARELQLPIPLGLEIVKKEVGEELAREINRALRESIQWAHSHRKEALQHAQQFGRGADPAVLDRFVGMYVNDDTLDLGEEGETALKTLYQKAQSAGLITDAPRIDIVKS